MGEVWSFIEKKDDKAKDGLLTISYLLRNRLDINCSH